MFPKQWGDEYALTPSVPLSRRERGRPYSQNIKKDQLMKEKILFFILITLTACADTGKKGKVNDICHFDSSRDIVRDYQRCFCGPDAFRVTATGVPSPKEKDPVVRKKRAVSAAKFAARLFMLETFKGHCIEQNMRGFSAE